MSGILDLVDFAGSNILGVNPTYAFAIQMDFQHDLGGCFAVFAKKFLQHHHHKFHGSEVVIEHDDLVHLRRLGTLSATL